MDLNKEQEFLLNGIQELTEDEMISIAGGYGEPTPPHEHDDDCYWVTVPNPYGQGTVEQHRVHSDNDGTSYGG
ncbi:hypothetical protein SNR37_001409 [Agarivorans aestuarii]|uniref:Bacteriocin n=1 Tax=Agarivorans aestuarii TaxID=1563703 RepID=A0ABU7GA82_9ALTE|nr:hypothetical protein [Agarivorans aestuarii]MEE1676082.1 hypothetical protein [Agarivorans aestuarii]